MAVAAAFCRRPRQKIAELLNADTRHRQTLERTKQRKKLLSEFEAKNPGRDPRNILLHEVRPA